MVPLVVVVVLDCQVPAHYDKLDEEDWFDLTAIGMKSSNHRCERDDGSRDYLNGVKVGMVQGFLDFRLGWCATVMRLSSCLT